MFNEEIHLRDYLRVILKWRWFIIAVTVPVVVGVSIKSFQRTPLYRATAYIVIEKTAPDIVSFSIPGEERNADSLFIETQLRVLKSQKLAKRVLQKLKGTPHMISQSVQESPPQNSPSLKWLKQKEEWVKQQIAPIREFLSQIPKIFGEHSAPLLSEAAKTAVQEEQGVEKFLEMIDPVLSRNSRIVEVSAVSIHPEQAAFIANTLVETYIEYNLETRAAAANDAVRWLVDEVENARKKVADSEAALQEYKEQHKIISFDDWQSIIMQKLASLSSAVNNAKIKRITLEIQYKEIQQYGTSQMESLLAVMNNPTIQQLKVELSTLESELSELQEAFRARHPKVTALRSRIEVVQQKIATEMSHIPDSIKKEYEMALAQEQELTKILEDQKQEARNLDQTAIIYGVLKKEVDSNQKIYNALLQRMKETSVAERLETTNIQIVDRANIPMDPINVNRIRSVLLAVVVGLVMGTSLAFFMEYWNDKIMIPEDFKRHFDIPFLGIIPKVSVKQILPHDEKEAKDTVVATVVLADPKSLASETFRGLRTHIIFSELNESKQGTTLLITSAEPSEGKSCTVANLGIVMAQSGQKTLIIDCDFRKPIIAKIFHLKEAKYGFSDVLMDVGTDNGITNVVHRTDIQNLHIIPCGTLPPNPSELLSLKKTDGIIKKLGEQYERILIDSPPVNVVADAMIISQLVSGVILICLAGETKRGAVQRSIDQLRDVGATIFGGVINKFDVKKQKYAYYNNHYYLYGSSYYSRPKETENSQKAIK